jgi:hypothetical protein
MNRFYNFVANSGVCAVSGAIAGAIVGSLFGLVFVLAKSPAIPATVLFGIALGLSLFAWLVVLLIVGVFGNYGVVTIAARALVTCLLAGIITVALIYVGHAGGYGTPLGWIVGFLIGKLLCAACSRALGGQA